MVPKSEWPGLLTNVCSVGECVLELEAANLKDRLLSGIAHGVGVASKLLLAYYEFAEVPTYFVGYSAQCIIRTIDPLDRERFRVIVRLLDPIIFTKFPLPTS